ASSFELSSTNRVGHGQLENSPQQPKRCLRSGKRRGSPARRATNSPKGEAISGMIACRETNQIWLENRISQRPVDLVPDGGIESCLRLRPRKRESRGKRDPNSHNLRVGAKARVVDGFKLWYSGGSRNRNGVGILVDGDLREQVVEVRRINDRLMMVKLVIGGCTLSLEDTDLEKIVIGGDFNGHIRATSNGFDDVHGGFGFGERNEGETSLLDFAKAFELVIANSCFPKKENHLVTFSSGVIEVSVRDRKVIPSENLTTQHKFLVMDTEIKRLGGRRLHLIGRGLNGRGMRGVMWNKALIALGKLLEVLGVSRG
ncbi:hypothetical protein H5410_064855, partial [Solanum commersonii]